jgi:OFA family oxalate/formate antiporter-like MFS transporter
MNKRALVVLAACFLTIFTAYATRYGYGILLPEMLSPLDITKTEAGVIYASFFIAYTVTSPVLGFLGDRYDARLVISSFIAVLGAGTFLMAYASSLAQASLFFALAGIGAAAGWAPVMAVAQQWTSAKNRGKTLAFIDVGSSVSIIVVSTVVPAIAVTNGWRVGWMSLGIMGLAIAVIDLLMVRNPSADKSVLHSTGLAPTTVESIGGTYARLLRDAKFWFIGLSYLLAGFAIIIPFTFLSTFAVKEMAFSYGGATRLMTVIGIGAIFGKLALGPLSDRVGRIKVLLLCVALVAAGTLGMASGQRIVVILSTVVFSPGYGTLWALYAALASDYFSRDNAGGIVGLWTVFLGVGSLIAPIIAGRVADISGTLGWSFVLAGAAAIASLILLVPVWKSRR